MRSRHLHSRGGAGLLIANGTFLHRDDFTSRFISHGTSTTDPTATNAAIAALNVGELPCSGGEQRILRLAASIAGGIPVSLGDTITGLDRRNVRHLLTAIRHASGERP